VFSLFLNFHFYYLVYAIFFLSHFSNIILLSFFITAYINNENDIECETDADCPKSVNMCFIFKCIDKKCKSIEILWIPHPGEYNKTPIERMSVSLLEWKLYNKLYDRIFHEVCHLISVLTPNKKRNNLFLISWTLQLWFCTFWGLVF
jgi:hypothetical protein